MEMAAAGRADRGLGRSPLQRNTLRLELRVEIGTANSTASVYGWRDWVYRSLDDASSAMRPSLHSLRVCPGPLASVRSLHGFTLTA